MKTIILTGGTGLIGKALTIARNNSAAVDCADCPYGRYQDERGFNGRSCKKCQDGYMSNVDKSGCIVEGSDP